MAYFVTFCDAAEREVKRLSLPARVGVARVLERSAVNPRGPGVRKIVGSDHLYRAKAGDYRVIFALHERRLLVVVVRVAHRSRAYRHLERLPPGWD